MNADFSFFSALQQRGYRFLLLEQGRPLNTILNFPAGKFIYAEPAGMQTLGALDLDDATKEELLAHWQGAVARIDIQRGVDVNDVRKRGDRFAVATESGEVFAARRVILAVGRMGNPRQLGLPGEEGDCVYTSLLNPGKYHDQRVVVIGGGNSAAEAAIALADDNQVSLIHRGDSLPRVSQANRSLLEAQQQAGRLRLMLSATVTAFHRGAVDIATGDGQSTSLAHDVAFVLIGADAPTGFFRRIGVRLEGQFSWSRALQFLWVFALVYSIYGIKFGKWPFTSVYQSLLAARVDPGLLYGILYTGLLTVFGARALTRYRHDRYQVNRYRSLIAAQWLIYFLMPWGLFYAGYSEWWRSWGVTLTYPLGYYGLWEPAEQLFSGTSLPWAVATLVAFAIVMPIASVYHGKRFCAWICPCGGMADTVGDAFRHKAPRGQAVRRLESAATVILVATLLCSLYFVFGYRIFGNSGAAAVQQTQAAYKLLVDLGLASIVAITLYPFAGSRIWCRFFCPLAKWMEMWARWTGGKLAIMANNECISCGECTRYCQMGIDVRAFAQREMPLSNVTTSCIFCGICVTVCPVDVLSVARRDGATSKGESHA